MTAREDLIPENIEAVCVEITKTKCKPVLVTTVYRPPNAKVDLFDKIEDLI